MSKKEKAFDLLREDHKRLFKCMEQYDQAKDAKAKEIAVSSLSKAFEVHNIVEETALYPVAEETLKNDPAVDQAKRRDQEIKLLFDKLGRLLADGDRDAYEMQVKELKAAIRAHTEEEKKLLDKMVKSDADMSLLSQGIHSCKSMMS